MYDKKWMKPDTENGFEDDPCMLNPMNCTEGFSWSVWENMMFGADIVDPSGGGAKKYIMSTGDDFNPKNGKAWPGFALYHQVMYLDDHLLTIHSTSCRAWTWWQWCRLAWRCGS